MLQGEPLNLSPLVGLRNPLLAREGGPLEKGPWKKKTLFWNPKALGALFQLFTKRLRGYQGTERAYTGWFLGEIGRPKGGLFGKKRPSRGNTGALPVTRNLRPPRISPGKPWPRTLCSGRASLGQKGWSHRKPWPWDARTRGNITAESCARGPLDLGRKKKDPEGVTRRG